MKVHDRVLWSEGMFLAPHHLQQLDRYHEAYTGARIAALGRPEWGVVRCELDLGALATGQVAIQTFSGVLPDGTPIAFGRDQHGDDPPPSRPIGEYFSSTQQSLDVFLALKREHNDAPNVDPEDDGARSSPRTRARFSVERRASFDGSSTRNEPVEVAYAKKNLTILFGDDPRDDYDAIKVFEIVRSSTGALTISSTYVPPCLSIRASSFLMSSVDELLSLMTAKQRGLSNDRRQHESSPTVSFQSQDITRYLQLSTLNAFLPIIKHFRVSENWPTEDAYLLLLQLAGQLSTFGELDPTTLPAFDYADLSGCFGELFASLRELLDIAVRSGAIAVPLHADGDVLVGKLDERMIACSRFVLAVKSDLSGEETARRVPDVARIASRTKIEAVKKANAGGIRISVTNQPPPEIIVRAKTVYFTITNQDPSWGSVVRDRAVAIHIPRPYNTGQPNNIELFAIPSTKV